MFVCRDSACEIFVKGNGIVCVETDKCGVYVCRDGSRIWNIVRLLLRVMGCLC